jgi:hypothetical protein
MSCSIVINAGTWIGTPDSRKNAATIAESLALMVREVYEVYTARQESERPMKRAVLLVTLAQVVSIGVLTAQRPAAPQTPARAQSAAAYFPDRFTWEHKKPEEVGLSLLSRR